MSETEHFNGKLIPTGKTLSEIDSLAVDIYDIGDGEEYIEFNGEIFRIDKGKDLAYEDIFLSSKNEDGSYNFHVKYYNGGCGLIEAIETALED